MDTHLPWGFGVGLNQIWIWHFTAHIKDFCKETAEHCQLFSCSYFMPLPEWLNRPGANLVDALAASLPCCRALRAAVGQSSLQWESVPCPLCLRAPEPRCGIGQTVSRTDQITLIHVVYSRSYRCSTCFSKAISLLLFIRYLPCTRRWGLTLRLMLCSAVLKLGSPMKLRMAVQNGNKASACFIGRYFWGNCSLDHTLRYW